MSFFALVLALMLEQARPLAPNNLVHAGLKAWSAWSRKTLDAGQAAHGWLAWGLAVVAPMLAATLIYLALSWLHLLLGFAWLVLVLYFTLGFRQFSHHFTAIRVALESGDELGARAALARWKNVEIEDLPRPALLRQVIEFSVLSAHRHVFGVLVCFVVLAALGLGPAGAVGYRVAEHVVRRWGKDALPGASDASQDAARRAWVVVDFFPVRVTALFFAVVGNFEEAIANWRQDAKAPGNDALLLSASAGAMNVRLSEPGSATGWGSLEGASAWTAGEDRPPQLAHLASVVGLVWRSVLLWLLLLALGMIALLV